MKQEQNAKMTEKDFMRNIIFSVGIIVLALFGMTVSAWAMFSDSVEDIKQQIGGANFYVQADAVNLSDGTPYEPMFDYFEAGEYQITLTAHGSVSKRSGFCKITVGEEPLQSLLPTQQSVNENPEATTEVTTETTTESTTETIQAQAPNQPSEEITTVQAAQTESTTVAQQPENTAESTTVAQQPASTVPAVNTAEVQIFYTPQMRTQEQQEKGVLETYPSTVTFTLVVTQLTRVTFSSSWATYIPDYETKCIAADGTTVIYYGAPAALGALQQSADSSEDSATQKAEEQTAITQVASVPATEVSTEAVTVQASNGNTADTAAQGTTKDEETMAQNEE